MHGRKSLNAALKGHEKENRKFLGGGRVIHDPSGTEIPRGGDGYFLELHNTDHVIILRRFGLLFCSLK